MIKLWFNYLINESEDQKSIKAKDVGKAAVGGYIAKKSLDHGLHRIFGLRGETHTTNKETAAKIKKSGNILDPAKGGTGASIGIPKYKEASKGHIHITGYNKDTLEKGPKEFSRMTQSALRKYQPIHKKIQKLMYRVAHHKEFPSTFEKFTNGEISQQEFLKRLKSMIKTSKGKTFHVMGSEDFYNKNFHPDPDDLALRSTKAVKVSNSKLGATVKGIKTFGLKGLRSSPKTRPLVGAAILAAGGYSAAKLSSPFFSKILERIKNNKNIDYYYVRSLLKKGKRKEAIDYIKKQTNKSRH